jgi:regulator of protease activity HflC (stomatin/prohibitin superfamily)
LLKDYAKKDDIKMNVITTSANPAGALLRDSIESALRNYVFKTLLDFDTLLQDNRKYKATIVAQFRDLLPGSLSSSKIRVRK